ncbi:MAG: HAD-IB family phosphatase [Candidatus Poseidonia sp.]|nr:HAD-IB family phosphatase [Poseidonia sp.]MBL6747384.1 HAD-IB family phosphatase [Poseidonia sp.]MBL6806718.1 HAD-IB family phosphatase [Poseidonia sp.]MBL6885864.1 HAD-IB family phosphatase [Poseidonia sp.]MBL6892240.1 HAD-IB family phosphatase [Poseidonia sp.]
MEGEVAAYFDLDGTLLNASSEKTLTAYLARRRPWRIPWGALVWTTGFLTNLLRGRALYDAARNRGHLSLASWNTLEDYSNHLAEHTLKQHISSSAWERLEWHRSQGHRLVLVTATVAPMAEAMAAVLGMDAVYGCGPNERSGVLSGSERGWSVPRRKGKVPVVQSDAKENGHDLSQCYGYGNTLADSWFMALCGHPIAINPERPLLRHATEHGWEYHDWI